MKQSSFKDKKVKHKATNHPKIVNKNKVYKTSKIISFEDTSFFKSIKQTVSYSPPFISYMVFNRLGLTIKNLINILTSGEDFEMHIINSNSKDNSWSYIQSLKDNRKKSKIKFPTNLGPIYGLNYNLLKRKSDQFFFTIDSSVFIKTPNWMLYGSF